MIKNIKLPLSTRWIILSCSWILTMIFLNTSNPVMNYLNTPRNIFMLEANYIDYAYLIFWALILILWTAVITLLIKKDHDKKVKLKISSIKLKHVLIYLGAFFWMLLLQVIMIIIPDYGLLELPETMLDLQFFEMKYWALISIINLALNIWSWGMMINVYELIKTRINSILVTLIMVIFYGMSWMLLMDGSVIYQAIAHILMGLPFILWTIKSRKKYSPMIIQWVLYEISIYLIYVIR